MMLLSFERLKGSNGHACLNIKSNLLASWKHCAINQKQKAPALGKRIACVSKIFFQNFYVIFA